jgi:type VI secretion system VgrG family protein
MEMEKEFLSVRLDSPAISAKEVQLREFSGRERISRLFEFDLYLVCSDPAGIDVKELMDSAASLVFERGRPPEEVCRVHGMIASVSDCYEAEWGFSAYRVRFVPRAWNLGLHETLEIYLEQSVPEIIETVLKNAGFSSQDFELRLRSSYPTLEFVVQYKETDLGFISRIAEHVGISFFFEHVSGKDLLVFTDENSGFGETEGGGLATYNPGGLKVGVTKLESETSVIPSKYVVRDYNYRTPDVEIFGQAAVPEGRGGEVVEYGPHCKTQEEAAFIAKVRSEEIFSGRRVFRGGSNEMTFSAGATFSLEESPRGEELELLLVEVISSAIQPVFDRSDGTERTYTNEFRAIPSEVTYRPPRVTPKPRIQGVLTGIVEPSDQQQYAEIDEEGRYLVRFLFDSAKIGERKASKSVRMAQPHSGQGYGMHFPLRPGVEVILTFVNGDPDRPIISGTVPNPQTISPVMAENLKKNVIRTGGQNQIEMDDDEGSERIKLWTPSGTTTFQLGSPNSPESGAMLSTSQNITSVSGMATSSVSLGTNTFSGMISNFSDGNFTHARPAWKTEQLAFFLSTLESGIGLVTSGLTDDKVGALAKKQKESETESTCWTAWKSLQESIQNVAGLDAQIASYPLDLDTQLQAKRTDLGGARGALDAVPPGQDDSTERLRVSDLERDIDALETRKEEVDELRRERTVAADQQDQAQSDWDALVDAGTCSTAGLPTDPTSTEYADKDAAVEAKAEDVEQQGAALEAVGATQSALSGAQALLSIYITAYAYKGRNARRKKAAEYWSSSICSGRSFAPDRTQYHSKPRLNLLTMAEEGHTWHCLSSTQTLIAYGSVRAMLQGDQDAVVSSQKGDTTIHAKEHALMHGEKSTEICSKGNTWVSAKKIVDIHADESMEVTTKTKDINVNSGKNLLLEAANEIVLKCGQAKMILSKNGDITLKGMNLVVEGSTKVVAKAPQVLVDGKMKTEIKSGATMKLQSTGQLDLQGLMLQMKASGMAKLEAAAVAKIRGSVTMIG